MQRRLIAGANRGSLGRSLRAADGVLLCTAIGRKREEEGEPAEDTVERDSDSPFWTPMAMDFRTGLPCIAETYGEGCVALGACVKWEL
jgi:hypothetical protein